MSTKDDKKREQFFRLAAGLTVPFVALTAMTETLHSPSCVPQPEVRQLCPAPIVWALPIHTEINSFNVITMTPTTMVATTSANSFTDANFIYKDFALRK